MEAEKFLIHYAFANLVFTWRVSLHFSLALQLYHLSAYSVGHSACCRTVIHLAAKQFKLLLSLRAFQRPILRVALLSLAQSGRFCATLFWDSLAPVAALDCLRWNCCICWHCLSASALSLWLTHYSLVFLRVEREACTKCEYDSWGWLHGSKVLAGRGCSHLPRYACERRLIDDLLQEYVGVMVHCEGIFQAVWNLRRRSRSVLHSSPCYLRQGPWRQIFGALELG